MYDIGGYNHSDMLRSYHTLHEVLLKVIRGGLRLKNSIGMRTLHLLIKKPS